MTGTGKASRRVGAVRVWTAASVIHSTFIHVYHNYIARTVQTQGTRHMIPHPLPAELKWLQFANYNRWFGRDALFPFCTV